MRAWWATLALRERRALMLGAVVVGAALSWALAIDPLLQAHRRLRADVSTMQRDLAWMREVSGQFATLRNRAGVASLDRGGRSLLALADASAREAGLGVSLKRVEPIGAGRVTVWVEGASFDQLVGWLDSLAVGYGITVDEIALDRGVGLGSADGRVTLADPPR
jgi:general secretion pathway protein M